VPGAVKPPTAPGLGGQQQTAQLTSQIMARRALYRGLGSGSQIAGTKSRWERSTKARASIRSVHRQRRQALHLLIRQLVLHAREASARAA
jgi:hypothetical protein